MLFSVSALPLGSGDSIADAVADFVREVEEAGLPHSVTAMSTVIEGDWDTVMPVLRRAQKRLLERYDRIYLSIGVDEHRGVRNRLSGAVEDVDRKLGHTVAR